MDNHYYEVRDTSNNTFLFDVYLKKTDTDKCVLGKSYMGADNQPLPQIKSDDNTQIATLRSMKGKAKCHSKI